MGELLNTSVDTLLMDSDSSRLCIPIFPVADFDFIMTSEEVACRLSDPSQALPSEVLCHLLSSLGPQSIAKSRAVSKAWRDLINSDSILHREVDLSRFYLEDRILEHLNRLSSLAHYKLWKLSLHLTAFCEGFHGRDDHASVEERAVKLDDVLEVVQLSRETLFYLTVNIDFDRNYGPSKDGLPFIKLFLPDLLKFPRLDHISIEASSFIGIESGNDRQGHKSFKISESEDEAEEWGRDTAVDQSQFALARIKFMKRVRKFTGSVLTFTGSVLTQIQGEQWVWPVLLRVYEGINHLNSFLSRLSIWMGLILRTRSQEVNDGILPLLNVPNSNHFDYTILGLSILMILVMNLASLRGSSSLDSCTLSAGCQEQRKQKLLIER